MRKTEKFIEKNKHLPIVPFALEVVGKGIEVDEMVSKLMEKVEELTLHVIRQEKEINELKKRVKSHHK